MKVALVQQPATTDRAANVAKGLAAVAKAAGAGAGVVCFAELAFDRFLPQERAKKGDKTRAESVPGPTTEPFRDAARLHRVVIVLNVFERDGDATYDCSPVIDADGEISGRSRMVHVPDFECFHERGYYDPGDLAPAVFSTRAGRIGVAICYDRHYPEYMRALAMTEPDLVVVPQAGALDEWPPGLFEAEMRAAAFQNGYYVALCNRVGREERIEFAGESFFASPSGAIVAKAGRGTEELLFADIDPQEVRKSAARTYFLKDRRPELYRGWLD